jgi:EAL domain-containing protein (putative c-di-GMP-specific phosphodiesterase class I)/GGDEF domain-containing protein
MGKSGGTTRTTSGANEALLPLVASPRERLRHAAWALILSAIMALTLFLEPLDWWIWNVQSRLSNQTPSGEIVFVEAKSSLADPGVPSQRVKLADALERLRDEGAARVYIDVVFSEPAADPAADRRLRRALAEWGPRAAFVNRIDISPEGEREEYRTLPALTAGNSLVWNGVASAWPGFTWRMPYAYQTSDGLAPSMAASIAGRDVASLNEYQIDYGFRSRSIQSASLDQIVSGTGAAASPHLTGKTVVIGAPRDPTLPEIGVPGQFTSPPSFVPIFAAETLQRGAPAYIPGLSLIVLVAGLLAAGAVSTRRERRYLVYAVATAAPLYAASVAPGLGLRLELSYCLPLLLAFALLRWRSNWKRRIAQIDPDTGLPTIRAFAQTLAQTGQDDGHVIVAKIHSYETILKTLDSAQRALYVRKLVERLRVADPRLSIHIDGHYLAWRVDHEDEQKLRGHLEGLRAIFAAPVAVGGHSIDVGITFGAARIDPKQGDRSLAAALAAVEETSEALEPVRLAQETAEGDSLWDLSLRSRIDAAMEAGEVFCVYQPKIDIAADRIVGVEALVRWEDPERGFIPPLHFVMQCEKAGRMEYLTRYVLQSACSAARLLHFRGSRITMSVNISATLLSDMRIVGIVRNVLQATDFDPNYLMLEITETARIRDLTQARAVLKALKALGTHLSMDDFGVGAANFEALRALPFDEIKIDRQFVAGAGANSKARAITASIVALGASARIAVVAEGAETEADLQMLREIGCSQVQGYALAKPMPLTNLLTFIGIENGARTAL